MGQRAPDGGVPTYSGKELLCMCKLGFQLCDHSVPLLAAN